MTQVQKPSLIRCPGCKKLVVLTQLDAHITGKHQTDIYDPPVNPHTGTTARVTEGMKGRWIREIQFIIQDYPRGFIMWTVIFMLMMVILIYGRI